MTGVQTCALPIFYGGGVKVDTVVVCGIPVEQIVTNLADLIVVIVGDGNNLPDGDVVLTANTGAITSLTGAFTYIEKGYVASIAPNHGREGTRIAVTGVNLFGGGDYLDTISLAGFKANVVNSSNEVIHVIAAAGIAGVGDVSIVSNRGSSVVLEKGWTYEGTGRIAQVEPSRGQFGTSVTITGNGLRGGGDNVVSVTLAGLEAHAITFENDTLVVAVAADGLEQYGSIRLTANSGAVLEITDSWRFKIGRASCRERV